SRRRHTRCYRDWSSDVCSSDLVTKKSCVRSWASGGECPRRRMNAKTGRQYILQSSASALCIFCVAPRVSTQESTTLQRVVAKRRSEERRVGKESRSRKSQDA